MLTRRGLFLGAASLLAAPSIVRAASLMPVRAFGIPHLWNGRLVHVWWPWGIPYIIMGNVEWAEIKPEYRHLITGVSP